MIDSIIKIRNFLFLLLIMTGYLTIYSQANSWYRTNGPYGAEVGAIIIDSSGNLFAGTMGGIYKSSNDGLSWSIIAFRDTGVTGLVINKKGYIFAYMGLCPSGGIPSHGCYGIYRSTDGGNIWSKLAIGYNSLTPVNLMAITKEGTLFAGIISYPNSSLICSFDDGNTWTQNQSGLNGIAYLYSLTFGKDSTMYLGKDTDGIYRSTDSGKTWGKVSSIYCNSLAVDSAYHIIAGNQNGIYISTDEGINWQPSGLQNSRINTIFIDSFGNIFAGTENQGLYKSTNDGITWIHTGLISKCVHCLTLKSGGNIYAGTSDNAVFKSTDNGNDWTQICTGFINSIVYSPVIESNDSILAPCSNGVFRSTNNGDNWEKIAFRDTVISSLHIDNGRHIIACPDFSVSGFFCSTDHGVSWQHYLKNHNVICATADQTNNFYAGTDSGLFRSTDGGNSWTNNGLITGSVSSILTITDKTILVCKYSAVIRSTDNGDSWSEVLSNVNPKIIQMDSQGTIYEAGGDDVFRSTDNGASWSNLQYFNQVNSLAINSLGYVFVWSYEGIIFRSTDQGNTWTDFSGLLMNEYLTGLGVDSKDNLYAGTEGHGIFRTTNSTPVNEKKQSLPLKYELSQNYPNPFNPSTTINYSIGKEGHVKITVYSIIGSQVAVIVDANKSPGNYSVQFITSALPSGIYFYKMESGDHSEVKKFVLLK